MDAGKENIQIQMNKESPEKPPTHLPYFHPQLVMLVSDPTEPFASVTKRSDGWNR